MLGSQMGAIMASSLQQSLLIQTPNIFLCGSNLLHNVSPSCQNDLDIKGLKFICSKLTKINVLNIYGNRVAIPTESFKLKNIAHSDETAYNDYK